MKIKTALLVLLIATGCKHARLTTEELTTPPKMFVVACCRDEVSPGVMEYPAFLPQSQVDLCVMATKAGPSDGKGPDGNIYLASRVDCGKWGNKIGDQYYAGKNY